jgi:2-(1,2-epoxy-1,2-dihydrophenyl)acetyl-CoA isomerase
LINHSADSRQQTEFNMTDFDSGTEQILVTLDNRVATITLNRPEARNALSPELSAGLRRAIAWAARAPEVGAVLLTGAGNAFCAGGDVKAMGERNTDTAAQPTVENQFQELRERHHGIGGALRALRKPSLAALPGPAAGAGMAIALACDLRIAADGAFLTTGYANIGLSGDYGIAWLLTRVVGPGRARQLMLTSERVTAEAALTMGLVNQVVPAGDLPAAAAETTGKLARGPSVAYAYIKDNLDEALSIDHATAIDREADRLLKTRTTEDHREAVAAFAEKRAPVFTGR